MQIKNIKIHPKKIKVLFKNKKSENFTNIWLRDHIFNEENWDFVTNQRKTFTAVLDPKTFIKKAKTEENGKYLILEWSDQKKLAKYSSQFLYDVSKNNGLKKIFHKTWEKKDMTKNISLKFNRAITKEGFKILLKNICTYGFCLITNCKPNKNSVKKIANKIGYIRQSIFGGLWSFEANNKMSDSAYSKSELRPHTDSTYSNDAPGLQLLLCCEYNAKGGESILVDGFKIAEKIKKKNKKFFKILSSIEVPGNYVGDGVFLQAQRPIFRLDKKDRIIQVSFNNYDRAPFRLDEKKTLEFYNALRKFDLMANDKKSQWRRVLKPGELLIINNWRVLHGRSKFKGSRKMSGCYINKEDFDSMCKLNSLSSY